MQVKWMPARTDLIMSLMILVLAMIIVAPVRGSIESIDQLENLAKENESIESKVIFYLYTRNSSDPEILQPGDVTSLINSHFNIKKPTKVIVHGFLDYLMRPMPQSTKDRFLESEDVNVIIVDWGKIAKHIDYFVVAEQTYEVGSYVGKLLDFLVLQGCDLKSFHLVGHSLGAHVSGFAGAAVKTGKPGRITGLDPAMLMFHHVDPSKRLDTSDALFVDVIHTSGGLIGLKEPLGHADFYPNGGKHMQPGCSFFNWKCSHIRSYQYFAESIQHDHYFPSMICKKGYIDPEYCEPSDVKMGNFLNCSTRGIYYLRTNDKYPYAPIHP